MSSVRASAIRGGWTVGQPQDCRKQSAPGTYRRDGVTIRVLSPCGGVFHRPYWWIERVGGGRHGPFPTLRDAVIAARLQRTRVLPAADGCIRLPQGVIVSADAGTVRCRPCYCSIPRGDRDVDAWWAYILDFARQHADCDKRHKFPRESLSRAAFERALGERRNGAGRG